MYCGSPVRMGFCFMTLPAAACYCNVQANANVCRGNLVVYTCSQSCVPEITTEAGSASVAYVEEYVVVERS
jgi:hypothetical protein